jgi:hypothetical protein
VAVKERFLEKATSADPLDCRDVADDVGEVESKKNRSEASARGGSQHPFIDGTHFGEGWTLRDTRGRSMAAEGIVLAGSG